MRYETITSSVYVNHRKKFISNMKSGALAVFNSNDNMPTNADGLMPFRQNNDLLHLSGIDQEETILVLFPDSPVEAYKEVLFLRETSPEIAIWEGEKFTKEQAAELSGIKTIFWLSDFERVFKAMMSETSVVYLNSNEHLRATIEVQTRDVRFTNWIKEHYPLHQLERSAPIMHRLRAVKSKEEIDHLQTACNITEKGFRRLLGFVKPGVMEYEIEAELLHEFIRNRSRGFAYSPIIASGFDSCVLHYVTNNKECKDGDILLLDVGAEYANYASDLTRTIPVNGRYNQRQKDVYNAVLRVHKSAVQLLRPGTMMDDYHREVGKMMEAELLGLGLLTQSDIDNQNPDWPAYKKYFMHGTSHFLGLDVHDVGNWNLPIEEGMVFTCEPGIYIREENLGIRIENDVVVTSGEPLDLMKNIPIEIEEIEDLMNA